MDKNQIIILLINAVITMVTTAIVVRLSLNRGTLGVTSKLKERFTPKVKAYMLLIFSLFGSITEIINLILILNKTEPVSRGEVLTICLFTLAGALFIFNVAYNLGTIMGIKKNERNPPAT